MTAPIPAPIPALTHLDAATHAPAPPTGRFTPTPDDLEGVWEGVPVCSISEHGDIVLLTTDRQQAVTAATAYLKDAFVDLNYVIWDEMRLRWAAFERQPEDADAEWLMHWASEGDAQAIQLYFLPA